MEPIKIYRTKNGTIITPYRKYQCRDLERNTSIYDKVYHKSKEMTGFFIGDYKDGKPAFVTKYLTEDYIASHFRNYEIVPVYTYAQLPNSPFMLKEGVVLSDIQGTVANEVAQSTHKFSEWFVNLETGTGKTVLGTYLSAHFGLKTMIICFMKDILKQWVSTYQNMTTIDSSKIMEINNGKILEDIYINAKDINECDIYLISHSLISSYLNHNPWWKFSQIMQDLGIGLLIFDEGHRNMSAMVKINALTNIKYTLYLSADYAQGDYLKERLYYDLFRNTKIIQPNEEMQNTLKHTKVIVVDYNSSPSVTESAMIYNKYGFSAELYMQYQIEKKKIFEVLDIIISSINKSRKDSYKTLILLEHISHVDIIYDYLCMRYKNSKFTIGRYHSKCTPEEKDATLSYSNLIISTYKSFGIGMDINQIKYVISLNQCNKVTANQAAGRSRTLPDGSDSIYFMVSDIGFPYCKKKMKVVLGYLMEKKIKEPPFVYHL